jgi:hypothetical protein
LDTEKENDNMGLEYVLLNGMDGELWEIDYEKNIALNVSDVVKQDSVYKLTTYSGNIEDFLSRERGCTNIHFHNSFSVPTRIHMDNQRSKLRGCEFK